MFKTIFSKLTIVFISITIFSFLIASLLVYSMIGKSVLNDMINNLNKTANEIRDAYIVYQIDYNTGDFLTSSISNKLFRQLLAAFVKGSGTMIWIVDTEGYIKTIAFTDEKDAPQVITPAGESAWLRDERRYKKVMSGNQDMVLEMGDFYGYFKRSLLTIEKPIKVKDENGKNIVVGAVYIHTPLPEIYQQRTSVFKVFMIAESVSFFISITLVYIFTRRITGPLKKISRAASIIAKGEFDQQLDIKSKDEIGQLAQSFNNMAFALQHYEENRREFIANVSHELRTPMTSIMGFIEGILDGTIPPEKQGTYLMIVRDEIGRMNRLVNDLLDLSRMESGEIRLVLKKVDINELIRRCIIKLESLIAKKSLDVDTKFENEHMFVKADIDGIERVIMNLIHNAIKFTPVNGKITVSTSLHKNKVVVTVEDNGIGIDKEEINKIWQRFYKSDKSRGLDKRGTGLGLAIVKSIVNAHKQDIWVESEPGKGTKFSFTLDSINVDEM